MSNTYAYGECAKCGRTLSITKEGKVRFHKHRTEVGMNCPGSGKVAAGCVDNTSALQ